MLTDTGIGDPLTGLIAAVSLAVATTALANLALRERLRTL